MTETAIEQEVRKIMECSESLSDSTLELRGRMVDLCRYLDIVKGPAPYRECLEAMVKAPGGRPNWDDMSESMKKEAILKAEKILNAALGSGYICLAVAEAPRDSTLNLRDECLELMIEWIYLLWARSITGGGGFVPVGAVPDWIKEGTASALNAIIAEGYVKLAD